MHWNKLLLTLKYGLVEKTQHKSVLKSHQRTAALRVFVSFLCAVYLNPDLTTV
jgi:hypothetical protein